MLKISCKYLLNFFRDFLSFMHTNFCSPFTSIRPLSFIRTQVPVYCSIFPEQEFGLPVSQTSGRVTCCLHWAHCRRVWLIASAFMAGGGLAQATLGLYTSSSSLHRLHCHHWGWEGKGRGQTCTDHTGYERPLTGPGCLYGKCFQGRSFKAPWVIWSLQATDIPT